MMNAGRSVHLRPPLLARVFADEGVVERLADEGDRLRLEVDRAVRRRRLRGLRADEGGQLGGRQVEAVELVDEREPERQEVGLPIVPGEHLVLVAVELDEAAHEVPDVVQVRVEDVRPVGVHFDSGLRIGRAPHVPADHVPLLQNQNLPARLREHARDGAAPEARTRDYDINFLHAASIAHSSERVPRRRARRGAPGRRPPGISCSSLLVLR